MVGNPIAWQVNEIEMFVDTTCGKNVLGPLKKLSEEVLAEEKLPEAVAKRLEYDIRL